MLPLLPLRHLRHGRSRNRIPSELGVEVKLDTRVGRFVEARSGDTSAQRRGACSLDFEIDALGIGLCAVGLACGVEGDDFVADDVVSRSDVGEGHAGCGVRRCRVVRGRRKAREDMYWDY